MLVEPFWCFIDVVVCALIGAADNHDSDMLVVDAVVVDRGLEHMSVFLDPVDNHDSTSAIYVTLLCTGTRLIFTILEYSMVEPELSAASFVRMPDGAVSPELPAEPAAEMGHAAEGGQQAVRYSWLTVCRFPIPYWEADVLVVE